MLDASWKVCADNLFLRAILVFFTPQSFLSFLHLTALHLFQREAISVCGSQLAQGFTALFFLELVNSGRTDNSFGLCVLFNCPKSRI